MKTTIDYTEADFHKYNVFIHSVLQHNVTAADANTGEVFRYQLNDDGEPTDNIERATGEVTIKEASNGD
jgi:hypothetical protein